MDNGDHVLEVVTGAADPSNKLLRQAAWRSASCNLTACPYFSSDDNGTSRP